MPIGLVSDSNTLESLAKAIELNCSYLCLNYKMVEDWDESVVQAIEKTDIHISLWTVNEPALLETLEHVPLNSIITDFPSRFAL